MVMSSCGQEFYVDARNLPPSGVLNRVMIAQQNPDALPFVDAYYDIRHPYNASGGSFSIAGYAGKGPLTIENLPEQQTGAVYGEDDGSLGLISYASEKLTANISIPGGLSSSVEGSPYNGLSVTRDLEYIYAANPINHVVSVVDRVWHLRESRGNGGVDFYSERRAGFRIRRTCGESGQLRGVQLRQVDSIAAGGRRE
jgi:hypothetical protein